MSRLATFMAHLKVYRVDYALYTLVAGLVILAYIKDSPLATLASGIVGAVGTLRLTINLKNNSIDDISSPSSSSSLEDARRERDIARAEVRSQRADIAGLRAEKAYLDVFLNKLVGRKLTKHAWEQAQEEREAAGNKARVNYSPASQASGYANRL